MDGLMGLTPTGTAELEKPPQMNWVGHKDLTDMPTRLFHLLQPAVATRSLKGLCVCFQNEPPAGNRTGNGCTNAVLERTIEQSSIDGCGARHTTVRLTSTTS